jgi:hypothetical protein
MGNWRDARAKELLTKLAQDSATFVRGAAIRAFANIDVNAAARLAAESNLPSSEWDPTFVSFLQRQGGGAALADAFKRTAPKAEVAQLGLQLMKDTGRREAALADRRFKAQPPRAKAARQVCPVRLLVRAPHFENRPFDSGGVPEGPHHISCITARVAVLIARFKGQERCHRAP